MGQPELPNGLKTTSDNYAHESDVFSAQDTQEEYLDSSNDDDDDDDVTSRISNDSIEIFDTFNDDTQSLISKSSEIEDDLADSFQEEEDDVSRDGDVPAVSNSAFVQGRSPAELHSDNNAAVQHSVTDKEDEIQSTDEPVEIYEIFKAGSSATFSVVNRYSIDEDTSLDEDDPNATLEESELSVEDQSSVLDKPESSILDQSISSSKSAVQELSDASGNGLQSSSLELDYPGSAAAVENQIDLSEPAPDHNHSIDTSDSNIERSDYQPDVGKDKTNSMSGRMGLEGAPCLHGSDDATSNFSEAADHALSIASVRHDPMETYSADAVELLECDESEDMVDVHGSMEDLADPTITADQDDDDAQEDDRPGSLRQSQTSSQAESDSELSVVNEIRSNELNLFNRIKVEPVDSDMLGHEEAIDDDDVCVVYEKQLSPAKGIKHEDLNESEKQPFATSDFGKQNEIMAEGSTMEENSFLCIKEEALDDYLAQSHLIDAYLHDCVDKIHTSEETRQSQDKQSTSLQVKEEPLEMEDMAGLHIKTEVEEGDSEESLKADAIFKPYKCDKCPMRFRFPSLLKAHLSVKNSKYHNSSSTPTIQCKECSKTFKSEAALEKHSSVHKPNEEYECKQCFKVFQKEVSLQTHLRSHKPAGPGTSTYSCTKCHKTYTNESSLKTHWSRVHLEYECNQCSKVFRKEASLQTHLRTHKPADPGTSTYSCTECPKTYTNESSLKTHCSRVHGQSRFQTRQTTPLASDINAYTCTGCGLIFTRKSTLEAHVKITKCQGGKRCAVCDKLFVDQTELESHMVKHESKRKIKPYACEVCLKRHNRAFVNCESEEIKHMCDICGARFKLKRTLEAHTKLKCADAIYSCSICPLRFRRVVEFRVHAQTHEVAALEKESDENGPLQKRLPHCSICKRDFVNSHSLSQHLKTHAKSDFQAVAKADENGWLLCRMCERAYANPLTLSMHLERHRGENGEWYCALCKKTAANAETLSLHMRKHRDNVTGAFRRDNIPVEPLKTETETLCCVLCKKSFGNIETLSQHMRKHRNDVTLEPRYGKKLPCILCEKAFKNINTLSQHMEHHRYMGSEELRNESLCEVCDTFFENTSALSQHMTKHREADALRKKEAEKLYCRLCKKAFPNLEVLSQHMKCHPSEETRAILQAEAGKSICELCEMVFANTSALFEHMKNHLHGEAKGENEKLYCMLCKKAYPSIETLAQHMEYHRHVEESEKMFCGICEKGFANAGALSQHMKNHPYGETEESHTIYCGHCEKSFKNLWGLSEHIKLHRFAMPLHCRYCDTTYYKQSVLGAHLKMHVEAGTSLRCKNCIGTVYFKNQTELHIHKVKKHSEENAVGRYRCEDCNIDFFIEWDLNMHMELHSEAAVKKIYKCEECLKYFSHESFLKLHMDAHAKTADKLFKCEHCYLYFGNESSFHLHLERHIDTRLQNECMHCGKYFQDSLYLFMHLKTHAIGKTVNEFKCHYCQSYFCSPDFLERHLKKHLESREEKFEKCSKVFANQRLLDYHEKTHSPNFSVGEVKCGKCDQYFNDMVFLHAHLKTHLENDESEPSQDNVQDPGRYAVQLRSLLQKSHVGKKFKCLECKDYFPNQATLDLHSATHTESSSLQLKCTVCQDPFEDESSLGVHMKTHIENNMADKRKFKCVECEDFFPNQATLDLHLTTHTESSSLQLKCTICQDRFGDESSLKVHMKTHIENDIADKKQYKCVECQDYFPNQATLDLHSTIHSENRSPPSQMMCILCQKPFEDKHSLDIHFKTHSTKTTAAKKQYKCIDCEGFFPNLATLHLHIRTHLENTNSTSTSKTHFKCGKCLKNFENQKCLDAHLLTHLENNTVVMKIYTCPDCLGIFPNQETLALHVATHLENTTSDMQFKCGKCLKHFDCQSSLEAHLETHSDVETVVKGLYQCVECLDFLPNLATLYLHLTTHLENTNSTPPRLQLKCGKCPQLFDNDLSHDAHLKTHSENLYKCLNCMQFFPNEATLDSHSTTHVKNITSTPLILLKCRECPERFDNQLSLDVHLKTHLKKLINDKEKHQCLECLDFFPNEATLSLHLTTHSEISTVQFDSLQDQQNGQDQSADTPSNDSPVLKEFKCMQCDKYFGNDSFLQKHMESHYYCGHCQQHFRTATAIHRHLKNHLLEEIGSNQCKCSRCDARFDEAASLKLHEKSHFEIPKPTTFADRSLLDNVQVSRHLVKSSSNTVGHEDGRDIDEQLKMMGLDVNFEPLERSSKNSGVKSPVRKGKSSFFGKCADCGQVFICKETLRIHVAVHQREEETDIIKDHLKMMGLDMDFNPLENGGECTFRFACDFCGERFPSKGTLDIHLDIHDELKTKPKLAERIDIYQGEDYGMGIKQHLEMMGLDMDLNPLGIGGKSSNDDVQQEAGESSKNLAEVVIRNSKVVRKKNSSPVKTAKTSSPRGTKRPASTDSSRSPAPIPTRKSPRTKAKQADFLRARGYEAGRSFRVKCEKCDQFFTCVDELLDHMAIHNSTKDGEGFASKLQAMGLNSDLKPVAVEIVDLAVEHSLRTVVELDHNYAAKPREIMDDLMPSSDHEREEHIEVMSPLEPLPPPVEIPHEAMSPLEPLTPSVEIPHSTPTPIEDHVMPVKRARVASCSDPDVLLLRRFKMQSTAHNSKRKKSARLRGRKLKKHTRKYAKYTMADLDSDEAEERSAEHNANERMRRNELRWAFEHLRRSIPSLASDVKATKLKVLNEATDLCTTLRNVERQKLVEKAGLRSKQAKLRNKLGILRRLLAQLKHFKSEPDDS